MREIEMRCCNTPQLKTSIALLFSVAIAPLAAQAPADLRQMCDGAMRPDVEVATFEHSDLLFPVRVVSRGRNVRPLPLASSPLKNVHFEANGKHYDLFDY